MMKITNKKPCIPPTIFTSEGSSAMYFMGIAMNTNTINEIPSKKAISLRRPMLEVKYFDIFEFCFVDAN